MRTKRLSNHRARQAVLGSAEDIFGPWTPMGALLASKTEPIDSSRRTVMNAHLSAALENLRTAPHPTLESWRDLSDMLNFLQSLSELGWAEDGASIEVINETMAALEQASIAYTTHGKLRLTASSLCQLQDSLEQFKEITVQLSAHSYWLAVKATRTRVFKILRGAKRPGDVVVAL